MNEQQTLQPIRKQIEAHIIAQAWNDETYKKELLSNPRAVIGKEFRVQLPAEVNVTVIEESPTSLYFVIPNIPNAVAEAELSEEQLETVAGGGPLTAIATGGFAAAGTLIAGGSGSDAIGNGIAGAGLGLLLPTP
ncbi:NHLP leader peptide family RiPP precursor [Nostoc sp.]|uniref:NHLP leader peptide family RiPP precursor n=1 Tax=Nostoc sp. TaxID=1180 RepID=UPI00359413E9